MSTEVYEAVAAALDLLPNGFPRTRSGTEIKLLQKIFSRVEAELAGELRGEMEPVGQIADRIGLPSDTVGRKLVSMARRGLVWGGSREGEPCFRLAPFIVGIYESQLETMDEEMAALFEKYMKEGGARGMMEAYPALHRVVPAQGSVRSDWILPYDDVKKIILEARHFRVRGCICRVQQDMLGERKCDFPVDSCLMLSHRQRAPEPDDLSREQALRLLDETEEVGLVHTVSNTIHGLSYVCNCCGCCCGILRGITEWGVDNSIARANYLARIDRSKCTGCGVCRERCQVGAISEAGGEYAVIRDRCIGCGLCVSTCPAEAIELERKRDQDMKHPPRDYAAWEEIRRRSRGLAS
jgi:NAD-dependent dihydropyrimidine dehydrogenase PreA subunit